MSDAKNSYSTLSDDVLALRTRDGDERAFNELVMRYLGRISFIARKYSARGYDHKDFVQEGLVGLFHAARSYRTDSEGSFAGYAMLVAERRFISIIRRQSALRSVPETAIVDIDSLTSEPADSSKNPEEELMLREQLSHVYARHVYARLRETLSKREFEVLGLYVDGLSYSSIAERLGITTKAVDNALQRVRRKVSGFDMS